MLPRSDLDVSSLVSSITIRAVRRYLTPIWILFSALLLTHSTQAAPWPAKVIVGSGYNRCPNFYRPLTVTEARDPTVRIQLSALSPIRGWPILGLDDGKYLGGEYGGVISSAPRSEAHNYKQNFCLATHNASLGTSPQPVGPLKLDAQGVGYYSDVRVAALQYSSTGLICGLFTRQGVPVIIGCQPPSGGPIGIDRLLTAFRLRSVLRVYLNHNQRHEAFPERGINAYTITALNY